MTRRVRGSLAALMLSISSARAGQTPSAQAFEVVSVKPSNAADDRTASVVQPGGRYTATNVTLRMLVKTAYGVHDDQIVGGPDWFATERFDITAKAEGNPPTSVFRDQARLMLRQALADRFTLVIQRERREIPVYALVLERDGGRFGPQFRRSNERECAGPAKGVPANPAAAEPIPDMPCGSGFSRSAHAGARALDFSTLVTSLSTWTDRLVVDRSGLSGKFDWDLQWTPDALSADATRPSGLSIFTALREQLGLKLESQRGEVEVLVVASAQRPEPD
jgi:uncharacterized protein (TIGR03435 family)